MKKTISIICILAFFNYIGCSSKEVMTKNSFIAENHLNGNINDIYVSTINDDYYFFSSGNYVIVNDSLSGVGKKILLDKEVNFNGKIALADILTIEQKTFNPGKTIILALGILAVGALIFTAIIASSMNSTFNSCVDSINKKS